APPPPTAQERPRPEVETQQQRKAPPPVEKAVESINPSVKSVASNGRNNDQSGDTSLVDSGGISYEDDYSSEDFSDASHPVAPPNTPAERQDVTSINSGSAGGAKASQRTSITSVTKNATNTGAVAQQTTSDRIQPRYPDPNEQQPDNSDEITLGQTVASSTYGEDRIKVVEKDLLDPYGDKGTYTGVGGYRFDQRHGKGIYKWHDGRIYDGEFLEDKRHGKGKFIWPDGAVYIGDFDGRYEGQGTCTWEDGRRYQGEWRNGMAHGQGIETYPNGTIRHSGQWIDDEPVR
ncbi:MAG: hypothetical protein SGARI_005131, partial [Bacillariaceae sp.]